MINLNSRFDCPKYPAISLKLLLATMTDTDEGAIVPFTVPFVVFWNWPDLLLINPKIWGSR